MPPVGIFDSQHAKDDDAKAPPPLQLDAFHKPGGRARSPSRRPSAVTCLTCPPSRQIFARKLLFSLLGKIIPALQRKAVDPLGSQFVSWPLVQHARGGYPLLVAMFEPCRAEAADCLREEVLPREGELVFCRCADEAPGLRGGSVPRSGLNTLVPLSLGCPRSRGIEGRRNVYLINRPKG
jgi:hypothetical protein